MQNICADVEVAKLQFKVIVIKVIMEGGDAKVDVAKAVKHVDASTSDGDASMKSPWKRVTPRSM